MMRCADARRRLSPYLDELLSLRDRAALEEHLEGCVSCRADTESLQAMLRSLRALEQPDTPELLPGIQARLTREPWWQRLPRRFVAPWPASLPLHGAALATTALLVIVVVGTQRPMKSLVDRKEQRADEVGQAIGVSARSTVEERQSDMTARPLANQAVAYEPYYYSEGASLETTAAPGTVADEVGPDLPAVIAGATSGAATPTTCPPCEKKRAELARQWDERPQVQWQVSDLASAAAQLNGWVQSKGGSVTTIDEHRLSVTLPEASVSEFLTQFSSSVSAPATISLDASPDSTRWVTISLELISPE